jgi:hypothetical protein
MFQSFQNRKETGQVVKCFRYLNVRYSDPHCIFILALQAEVAAKSSETEAYKARTHELEQVRIS